MKPVFLVLIILMAIPLQALFLFIFYKMLGKEKQEALRALFKKRKK